MHPVRPAALAAFLLFTALPVAAEERAGVTVSPAEAAALLEAQAGAGTGRPAESRAGMLRGAGQLWLMAGLSGSAIQAQSKGLALVPGHVGLLIDRSIAHSFARDYWSALDDLYLALDAEPENVEALVFRAAAYRGLGAAELSRDDLDRALALDPDHADALLDRGELRIAAGDRLGGAADWRRLLAVAPQSQAAENVRRSMARLGWADGAEVAQKPAE